MQALQPKVGPGETERLSRRLSAFAVDMVVSAALVALVLLPLDLTLQAAEPGRIAGFHHLIDGLVVTVVWWLYFTVPEALFGSTVGKIALGLRVVCIENRAKPTFRQAALRNLGRFIDALPLGVPGLLSMRTSPLRQRLGDRWAHTTVVSRSGPSPA